MGLAGGLATNGAVATSGGGGTGATGPTGPTGPSGGATGPTGPTGAVASVTAASAKIVVAGTGANPTVDVGTGIPESAITSLSTDLLNRWPVFSPLNQGGVADGKWVKDGAMSSGSSTLTSASAPFTSTAVDGGKPIYVFGAGAAGVPLVTTIASVTNSTTAVLTAANASGGAVSAASVAFGTDNNAAIAAAITAATNAGGGIVHLSPGFWLDTGHQTVPTNVTLRGAHQGPLEPSSSFATGKGTTILVIDTGTAYITMSGRGSQVADLQAFWPMQIPPSSAATPTAYPYFIQTNTGIAAYSIRRVSCINAYDGIFCQSGRGEIEDFWAGCLHWSIKFDFCDDVVWVRRVMGTPYWNLPYGASYPSTLDTWVQANGVLLELQRLAAGNIDGAFVIGRNIGAEIVDGDVTNPSFRTGYGTISNFVVDTCNYGVKAASTRFPGWVFTNTIFGIITATVQMDAGGTTAPNLIFRQGSWYSSGASLYPVVNAGTVQVEGVLGTGIGGQYFSSGSIGFQPSGVASTALSVANNASAVNGVAITGVATGGAPIIKFQGSSNTAGIINTNGTGALNLRTGGTGNVVLAPNALTCIAAVSVTSAVNSLQVTNAIAGAAVKLETVGTSTDIPLNVVLKGAGELQINGAAGSAGQVLTSGGTGASPTWAAGGGGATGATGPTGPTGATGGTGSTGSAGSAALGYFGDGSDSTVTLDGTTNFNSFSSRSGSTYTLTRDVMATSMTVNSTVILVTGNFRIYCTGTFTNNGTVNANGGNASGTNGGTGGTGAVTGTLITGTGNTAGITGTTGAGAKNSNISNTLGGAGGAGGVGGVAGGTAAGATATATAPNAANGGTISTRTLPFCMVGTYYGQVGVTAWQGGPGGSSGAGDGTNVGGGGGGGAGAVLINAKTFNNTVANGIQANGGNGGTPTTAAAGNGVGGGGGGGGGWIIVNCQTDSSSQVLTSGGGQAAGGTKGNGLNGSAGSGAGNGVDGGTGTVRLNVLV